MVHKSVAEILHDHVTFELEAIDRMYLNAYVPSLQTGAGFVYFVKTQLGVRVPSTVMVAPMRQRFVDAIERFAAPGFPIWLWYFYPSDQRSRLDCRGFRMRNPTRMGDTLWVRKKLSPFSSRSTGF